MYLRILKSSEIFPYKRLPSWQTLWFHNLSSTTFVDRWKQIDFSFPGWSIRSFHIYVEKTFGWCFDVVLTSLSHHVRALILAKDSEPNFLLIFVYMSRIFSCQWKHPVWSVPLSHSSIRHSFCQTTHSGGPETWWSHSMWDSSESPPWFPHSDFTQAGMCIYTDGFFQVAIRPTWPILLRKLSEV